MASDPGWAPTSSILTGGSFSGPRLLHLQNGHKVKRVGLAYPTSGNLTLIFLEKLVKMLCCGSWRRPWAKA